MISEDFYSSDYSEEEIGDYDENTLRKRFTPEEDKLLKQSVKRGKSKTWEAISQLLPGRTARQCRDRYNNYLFKQITNAQWTEEEDQIIIKMYEKIGSKWTKISKSLQGRSGNNVKNRWYKCLSKKYKLMKQDQNFTLDTSKTINENDISKTSSNGVSKSNENDNKIDNDFEKIDSIFDFEIFNDSSFNEVFDFFES